MKSNLFYLATPYSKWPTGVHNAYVETAKLTGRLLQDGYKVYSPITHGHPLSLYANIDPYAHDIWLPFDEAMMTKADALLVATFDGWDTSKGVEHEIRFFDEAGKDIYFVNPVTLRVI